MHKIQFWLGLCPIPYCKTLKCSPNILLDLGKERGKKRKGRKWGRERIWKGASELGWGIGDVEHWGEAARRVRVRERVELLPLEFRSYATVNSWMSS